MCSIWFRAWSRRIIIFRSEAKSFIHKQILVIRIAIVQQSSSLGSTCHREGKISAARVRLPPLGAVASGFWWRKDYWSIYGYGYGPKRISRIPWDCKSWYEKANDEVDHGCLSTWDAYILGVELLPSQATPSSSLCNAEKLGEAMVWFLSVCCSSFVTNLVSL